MIDGTPPRMWLKAFWGFEPEKDGYLGFTRPFAQERFVSMARPGDLVMIYGTDTGETRQSDRRQVLGFVEVDPVRIMDTDRMSPARAKEKADLGWADRWTHAVPVKRAWRCQRRIEVKDVATSTLTPARRRLVASMGALLSDDEAHVAFSLPVRACNVFGEPPVEGASIPEIVLRKVFRPSRGLTPAPGSRESVYEDGDHFLYVALAEGDVAAFLGRLELETAPKSLVKIGYSNDLKRRYVELNSGFPPNSAFKWTPFLNSVAYDDGASAKTAEDRFKSLLLDAGLESLGGEFFFGNLKEVERVFRRVPGVANFIRSPARRRS